MCVIPLPSPKLSSATQTRCDINLVEQFLTKKARGCDRAICQQLSPSLSFGDRKSFAVETLQNTKAVNAVIDRFEQA